MEIRRTRPEDAGAIATAEELIFSDPWTYEDILKTVSTEGAMCYSA